MYVCIYIYMHIKNCKKENMRVANYFIHVRHIMYNDQKLIYTHIDITSRAIIHH